jgi:hypothetical protein
MQGLLKIVGNALGKLEVCHAPAADNIVPIRPVNLPFVM